MSTLNKPWTPEEDAFLHELVKEHDDKKLTRKAAFTAFAEKSGRGFAAIQTRFNKQERSSRVFKTQPKPKKNLQSSSVITGGQKLIQQLLGSPIEIGPNTVVTLSAKELHIKF